MLSRPNPPDLPDPPNPQAGTKSVAKEELAAQLAVWHDAGMDAHIPQAMHDVYALLAGGVGGWSNMLLLAGCWKMPDGPACAADGRSGAAV